MEVYNFKCKNCGSTKYVKVDDNIFECQYCGYREEVLGKEPQPDSEPIAQQIVEPETSQVQIHQSQREEFEDLEQKSNSAAELRTAIFKFILVLFLGGIGIHHFIENRILVGFIYVCTFGLFMVGWVIDDIIYFVRMLQAASNYLGASHEK